MLKAFCCVEPDSLPQLIVAVSSFMRHNPDVPVTAYCRPGAAVEPLRAIGANIEQLPLSSIMMGALDHMSHAADIGRALHIGANTLTQDHLREFSSINMDGVSLAVSSYWPFAPAPEYHGWYDVEDREGEAHRGEISDRYFTSDFIMFNLAHTRKLSRQGYLLDFIKSRMAGESDFLNLRFKYDCHQTIPSNINVATERTIHHHLPTLELIEHHTRMCSARVARFPGEVVPWRRFLRFDRVSMQLPMLQYAEAARFVSHLLPSDFLTDIEANLEKSRSYIGALAFIFSELRAIETK